ncbi:MAG: carboxypeptidase regulatory-like domain-containing protein [Bryobacterales bacterium]|nr:carboxypeptidase regulatory-like domain-containing protein [Bryobacterales bacterium]
MKAPGARGIRLAVLLSLVILAAGSLPVAAQQFGEIRGMIRDATGSVIVGATVEVLNAETQQTRRATSTETGDYVVPYLVPGNYAVRAEKSGFKLMTRSGVGVQIGTVSRIDFTLEVGSISQSIEVTGGAPLLNTDSVALGNVLGATQIANLPLNGRDYLKLVTLDSNAVGEMAAGGSGGLQGGVRSNTAISIAGQRLEYNHYTLDGAENTDPNFNSYVIHPSVDYVQEFKVQTGVYSAEFGRGASQINVNTLPGTNVYHGSVFEFLRNDKLDAKQWRLSGAKNPFRRNNYGFTLGGPVSIPKVFSGRDRLFFMSNFEAQRDRTTTQMKANIPTPAMRSGDFSATNLGFPKMYDPATRVFYAGGGGTADPFPGNKIPASQIDSAAINLMKYYPDPTYPDILKENFIRNSRSITDSTQFNQRIDWIENQKSSWFGRYSWGDDQQDSGGTFYFSGGQVSTRVRQAVLSNTRMLTTSMVNDARFAWNRFQNDYVGYFANKEDIQSTLGIKGLYSFGPLSYGLPAIGISHSVTGPGAGATPWITRNNTFQVLDSLSILKSRHSLKVGGEIRRVRYNQRGNQKELGEFIFDGQSTAIPTNMTGTGYGFADFLVGLPAQYYRVLSEANGMMRSTYAAGYIQDDWKITSRLTLNLGLRYENTRPWVDKYDAMINAQVFGRGASVDGKSLVSTPAPIFTRPGSGEFYDGFFFRYSQGQLVQRGDQFMGRALLNPDNRNWGPRIGLAWHPGQYWSVRAGFGIYYVTDVGNVVFDMARNMGGKDGTVVPANQRTVRMRDPWAVAAMSPQCPGYTGVCSVAPQFQANMQTNRTGYVGQYLLNIQRELTRNVVLELGYLGNQGHHLQRFVVYNQAILKSGPTDTRTTAQRRPWPAYGPIQEIDPAGNSNYHAGNVKITQRPLKGLAYTVAYTYSKALDLGSGTRTNSGDTLWPWNSYNLRSMYGPSQFHMPHRFVSSYVYDLPVGPGQRYVNEGVMSHIIGGWQVGGILTLAYGTAIQGSSLGDTAGLGTLMNVPFVTGVSPIPQNRTSNNYWNADAFDFSNPDLGWSVGNQGRNTLFTPGQRNFDASLARIIRIREGHSLNFRFEAFNAPNHPNWNTPPNDPRTKATFGIVTSAKTMRQLQFALKYSF